MANEFKLNPKFMGDVRKAVAGGVDAASIALQGDLKLELSKQGKGWSYRKKGGRVHIASAPGDPPAPDLGTLRRSVQRDTSRLDSDLSARTGTNMPYGRWLEHGTRKMAARPWMRPVAERFLGKLIGFFKGVIQ